MVWEVLVIYYQHKARKPDEFYLCQHKELIHDKSLLEFYKHRIIVWIDEDQRFTD